MASQEASCMNALNSMMLITLSSSRSSSFPFNAYEGTGGIKESLKSYEAEVG